jgi:RNA polymerase sigma-70 factor (ECF subfamily)
MGLRARASISTRFDPIPRANDSRTEGAARGTGLYRYLRLVRSREGGRPAVLARSATLSGGDRFEAELVAKARDGDSAAFTALVRKHADRLYAVLLRFTRDPEEAEDALQEALLRAWRSIGRFELRSSFFTWLYRIGVNEAKRRAERSPRSEMLVSAEDHDLDRVRDQRPLPDAEAAGTELRKALEVAIGRLPLDYRIPLVLRDVEGIRTSDAAAVMELGQAAFKSRLHRARMAVREELGPLLDEPETKRGDRGSKE